MAASTNESAHILAAKQQSAISRMGGPGRNHAQYRFWLVMAIGAGAVGSFLAVVVFAVGQYRKVGDPPGRRRFLRGGVPQWESDVRSLFFWGGCGGYCMP